MKALLDEKGKERMRSTHATVLIAGLKKNKSLNQSIDFDEKYKEGRIEKENRKRKRKKKKEAEADAAAAADVAAAAAAEAATADEYVTPQESSMNVSWVSVESDFEHFLNFIRSLTEFDEAIFDEGMINIFGKVSKNTQPSISVTTMHIRQLESLREFLRDPNDKSQVTAWIDRLQKYRGGDGRNLTRIFVFFTK